MSKAHLAERASDSPSL